jgi:hypothetical protein
MLQCHTQNQVSVMKYNKDNVTTIKNDVTNLINPTLMGSFNSREVKAQISKFGTYRSYKNLSFGRAWQGWMIIINFKASLKFKIRKFLLKIITEANFS